MRSGGPAREGISAENAQQVQHAVEQVQRGGEREGAKERERERERERQRQRDRDREREREKERIEIKTNTTTKLMIFSQRQLPLMVFDNKKINNRKNV